MKPGWMEVLNRRLVVSLLLMMKGHVRARVVVFETLETRFGAVEKPLIAAQWKVQACLPFHMPFRNRLFQNQ